MKKLSRIEKDTCNLSATRKEINKFPENHDETAVKNPDFHSRFFFHMHAHTDMKSSWKSQRESFPK